MTLTERLEAMAAQSTTLTGDRVIAALQEAVEALEKCGLVIGQFRSHARGCQARCTCDAIAEDKVLRANVNRIRNGVLAAIERILEGDDSCPARIAPDQTADILAKVTRLQGERDDFFCAIEDCARQLSELRAENDRLRGAARGHEQVKIAAAILLDAVNAWGRANEEAARASEHCRQAISALRTGLES